MKKHSFALIPVLMCIIFVGCAAPSLDDFTFTSSTDTGITVTGYTGSAQSVELPETHSDKLVTTLSANLFKSNTTLKSIVLPKSVLTIADAAFIGATALESITVHQDNIKYEAADGVLFSKGKFNLACYPTARPGSEYTLPNETTTILPSAFEGNPMLEKVNLSSVKTIDRRAFFRNSALKSVDVPLSVASIGSLAFASCHALETVSLPSGIASIDDYAFEDCPSLKTIRVHEGTYAEQWCKDHGFGDIIEYA